MVSRIQKTFGMNDKMPFGKHKGEIVKEVFVNHFQYLLWVHSTVEWFHLSDEVVKLINDKESSPEYQRLLKDLYGDNYDSNDYDPGLHGSFDTFGSFEYTQYY